MKRARGPAQGTVSCLIPCVEQSTRGTSATSRVLYCIVSKCRHDRVRVSWRGHLSPHAGHVVGASAPRATNTWTEWSSIEMFTSTTSHGGSSPRSCAYKSRSRILGCYPDLHGHRIQPPESRKSRARTPAWQREDTSEERCLRNTLEADLQPAARQRGLSDGLRTWTIVRGRRFSWALRLSDV